jgi:hypothetical protein
MIRKLNYTGRKKIKRSQVHIEIVSDENGSRSFNLRFSLKDLALPSNARVYIEAYHRSGYRRFDYGTIEKPKRPKDRRLDVIPKSAAPLFRIKVVDRTGTHGRILASLDKIRPEGVESAPAGSRSLLFVEYENLGNKIWSLDLDGDWPVLKLNRNAEEIGLVAGSDPGFLSLVYPEVLGQTLHRIILKDQHTDPDCDDDWPSLWLKLACSLPGVGSLPPHRQVDQQAWIDSAVEAFCAQADTLEKFNQSLQVYR